MLNAKSYSLLASNIGILSEISKCDTKRKRELERGQKNKTCGGGSVAQRSAHGLVSWCPAIQTPE